MTYQISVNGQQYASWEEVPEETKQMLAKLNLPDADHNGVPDLMEGKLPTGKQTYVSSSLSINGKPVTSLADVPGPLRSLIGAVGALGNGAITPPATSGDDQPATTPGTPHEGQMVLNGQTVSAASTEVPAEKKGFFARLFGR